MSYRMAVDIGGTFTDLVICDGMGTIRIFKTPSTPDTLAKGVLDVLDLASMSYCKPLKELLSDCDIFVHGTTIAINAVIERKTAKTGLICTRGFRDILYFGGGEKPDTFNFKMAPPEPYIPRYLTLPVTERISSEGKVIVPLNEEEVRQALRKFREWGVQAIAVCLLWSPVNPTHEQRIARLIQQEWPEVPWSISSEVQPVIREWQRTLATVLDASVKPIVKKYFESLQQSLTDRGFKRVCHIVVASGGVMAARDAAERPVYTLVSGPATGPLAGCFLGQQLGINNLMTIDMGGTSFDVCLVRDGLVATTRRAKVSDLPLGISTVAVNSLGSGGGSIAWVDRGGLLHVGPKSAGAFPGPACYALGGEEPTVTDANVMLGYINQEYFLGGRIRIAPKLSERAIKEKIANLLKLGVVEAANGILSLVNQNMIGGMVDISIKEGIDPREFLLIAAGGACPVHAARLAQGLGMKQVLIPKVASAFCAFGMLTANLRFDHVATYFTDSSLFDCNGVNQTLASLKTMGQAKLDEAAIAPGNQRFVYYTDARYPFQAYEIEMQLRSSQVTDQMVPQLVQDFHAIHETRYGFRDVTQTVECINWKVVATGLVPKIILPEQPYGGIDSSRAYKGIRKAYFEELGGFVDTPLYDGEKLTHGNRIDGPAIIEEATTTIIIIPRSFVTVTRWGDYLMQVPTTHEKTYADSII